jgi:glycosyltransferase involved in cell wall biosynthesis
MTSIIIPAHNEEPVIGRCLAALLAGARRDELDIIVVCNGCTDRTAEVARGFAPHVRVLTSDVPSKARAINLGDAAARSFPRFVVDADVLLPLDSLRQLDRCLRDGRTLAAAPRFHMDLAGCGWAVRAFYDINGRLPSAREGFGGSGVYGLSADGRRRFAEFPKLIADDAFVRVQFTPDERVTLPSCHSTVFAPRTLADLVAIKTRSHLGNRQIRRSFPHLWVHNGPGNRRAMLALAARPWLWPRLAVYAYVKLAARLRASRGLRRDAAAPVTWERDETSRTTVAMPMAAGGKQ